MFSLLATRTAFRSAYVPARALHIASSRTRNVLPAGVVGKRPFSLSVPGLAAAKTTADTKTTDSKTTREKKAAGGTKGGKKSTKATSTTAKATTPKKPKKKPTPKKPKKAKKPVVPKLKVTAQDKPPKSPPTPWILFVAKQSAGEPMSRSLADRQTILKNAANVWKAMTPAEKKPFIDESAALRPAYEAARAEWERNIDPAKLKLMNAARMKRNLPKIRINKPVEERRPVNGFSRFLADFRNSNHGVTQGNYRNLLAAVTVAGGKAWKGMSEAEKKPYIDAAKKERDAYLAKNAQNPSA